MSNTNPDNRWIRDPVNAFVEFTKDHGRLVELTRNGVMRLTREPALVEAMIHWETVADEVLPEESPPKEARLQQARDLAESAQRLVDTDFWMLHAHALVLLWSALESLIIDFSIAVLQHDSGVIYTPEWGRVKLKASEFVALPEEDRAEILVLEYERAVAASTLAGLSRFEATLKGVGLDGPVRASLRRELFELHQLRNVIAHRRGIVDRRFTNALPDLPCEIGTPVPVDHPRYHRLEFATIDYAFTIHARACQRYGGVPVEGWEPGGQYESTTSKEV